MRGGEEGERKRNGTRHDSLLPDRFNPREIIQREEYPLDPRWIERESSCGDRWIPLRILTSLLEINRERERLRLECITGLTGGGIALPLT